MSDLGTGTVIGLEVHVRLATVTKLFCGCPAVFGASPNSRVCPMCLGLPGALPTLNGDAVRLAVRAALALGYRVERTSEFVRKQYFYPDLPKGYQITQYAHPLARQGSLRVPDAAGGRRVPLRRLQLEEDAGKSVHDQLESSSLLDFNRCGLPLIEIVTEPVLRSPSEARAFLVRLRQVLERYARVSDCRMEEGELRADANISLVDSGGVTRAGRVEVKNLNSFAHVERALAIEERRLAARVAEGHAPGAETRLYDAEARKTRALRGKEEVLDYRYMPEPDLPPLRIDEASLRAAADGLPPAPAEVERRLIEHHGLSPQEAARIANTPGRAAYLEATVADGGLPLARTASGLVLGQLAAERKRRGLESEADLLPPAALRRLAQLRLDGRLSARTAARALELLFRLREPSPSDVDELVASRQLTQVAEPAELERWIRQALAAHPGEVERYRAGEERLLGYFMGEVMRASSGRADPRAATLLLRALLRSAEG
jgi:aspartyl-tRNA(Asn)/glutamyl-tRNA(Gln) amidotransferase subunit B